MLLSFKRIVPAALAAAIAVTGALSATQPASAEYTVAGAPGVANVSVVEGGVAIVRGDGGGQVDATINSPLLPGDYVSAAGGSRAEVQFDGISMLRLAQDTQVRIVNLDPASREMQLAAGTAELSELRGADGSPQLDTPSLSVRANRAGNYRVSVLGNGETLVTVRSGSATIAFGSGTRILAPGSTLVARGPYGNARITFAPEIATDAFDAFNARRDAVITSAYGANRYLSPSLAGYANFADYGRWYDVPNYGEVWAPYNQSNDWSPYSNGQWVWEPGYGYTWVGNEPWGYAPYHYGNWFYSTGYNQWMWEPPAYQYQSNSAALAAAWLPALVGFFLTGGSNGGYNPYGYGAIGWVPLAPGEPYVPWYAGFGAGASYPPYLVKRNVTIINIYRNIRYVKIVRIYDFDRFRDGDWHRPILMHPDQLARVGILRGSVPIVPTKALMHGGTVAVAHPITLSSRFAQERFASHRPALTEMTFDESQKAIETVVNKAPKAVIAPAAPVRVAPPVRTAAPVRPSPVRTAAPERPVRTAAPVRETAPAQPARTAAPARTPVTAPERQPHPDKSQKPTPEATPRHA